MNFLNRGNDLEEFFWPIFYFVKEQILVNKTLPLWNNLFFAGTPLLPDPQAPLFYLPNIIFLVLPIDTAFLVSFFLHATWGGFGAFWAARRGFRFSRSISLFCAALWVLAPRLWGYLEAGHFGLLTSWAWLPFVLLSILKIAQKPNVRWAILFSVSLAAIFYTHLLTFALTLVALIMFWAGVLLRGRREFFPSLKFLLLGFLLTFGLTAIALLPQIEWVPQTTRFLLLETRETFPVWSSSVEFMKSLLWPWGNIQNIDTEKWLALGIFPIVLALFGFLQLTRKTQVMLLTLLGAILLLSLNNASPIYQLLLQQNWFVLLRVATRVWFIPVILTTFLAAYGFEALSKKGMGRSLLISVVMVTLAELLALSWLRLAKPPTARVFAPPEVYQFFKKDSARFRVFCTTRCLSQKETTKAGLELLEGYGTLQQNNYFKQSWQLMGGYWNYYTLAVPPIGFYQFEKPQPDAISLGAFNVKYVISPYSLSDKNFVLQEKFGDYSVYQNKAFLPRAYFWQDNQMPGSEAPIRKYTPNHIRVDTERGETSRLVLAEVYSPGWKAYLNGNEEAPVQETPNVIRLVDLETDTKFVDFKYQPGSYNLGRAITLLTVLLLIVSILKTIHSYIGVYNRS